MIRTESFLIDSQSALVERFRLSILALDSVEFRQVVETLSHIRMVRCEYFLVNGKSALMEYFGLGILALRFSEARKLALMRSRITWAELRCVVISSRQLEPALMEPLCQGAISPSRFKD